MGSQNGGHLNKCGISEIFDNTLEVYGKKKRRTKVEAFEERNKGYDVDPRKMKPPKYFSILPAKVKRINRILCEQFQEDEEKTFHWKQGSAWKIL